MSSNTFHAAIKLAFQAACNDFLDARENSELGSVYLKLATAIEDAYPSLVDEHIAMLGIERVKPYAGSLN
jgi:hypothetical protein